MSRLRRLAIFAFLALMDFGFRGRFQIGVQSSAQSYAAKLHGFQQERGCCMIERCWSNW
ncbi:hypothetical protein [Streptomyces sp. NPDC088762]|uniref:hypothetical protein n=1 Tax=Streptomyces sp. NPDC088762 TaxID=3365891 RepID=UPI00382885C8